jgi:5-methylcytosine-specific restriction endonuclease McrA
MRFELVIILITGLIIANMYTEGKYLKTLLSFKKYYKMIGVAFVGLTLCWLFRKNPDHARVILNNSNEYVKYLPIDKNVTSMFTPLLNLSKNNQSNDHNRIIRGGEPETNNRLFDSGRADPNGKKATKRSVSETKKKFVAARQNWHCGDCKNQLSAWFEVDHTVRLENGGSNHIDNLVALCRECHGKKTAIENL